jgi:DNA-binding transcriptional LysR family regulator
MDRLAAMATFARVVETGSFSAAARDLGIGQPAISKNVAALEASLGVRLLVRTTRGLTPTEAGTAYALRARQILDEADEADANARGSGKGLSGRLRFAAPVTFARLHVVPHLGSFLTAHPAITLDAILDDRAIDLIGEGVDIAQHGAASLPHLPI